MANGRLPPRAARTKAAASVGPAHGAHSKASSAPAAAWPSRPDCGRRLCRAPPSSCSGASAASKRWPSAGTSRTSPTSRISTAAIARKIGPVAEIDAERRQEAADEREGRGEPRRQRQRRARILRPRPGDDDRDQRQHAGAQDGQDARAEGQRQGPERHHCDAFIRIFINVFLGRAPGLASDLLAAAIDDQRRARDVAAP